MRCSSRSAASVRKQSRFTGQAVLAVDPKNSVALHRRAILCAERGENTEALRLIEAAIKANPAADNRQSTIGRA
jgi:hypothetical protein